MSKKKFLELIQLASQPLPEVDEKSSQRRQLREFRKKYKKSAKKEPKK